MLRAAVLSAAGAMLVALAGCVYEPGRSAHEPRLSEEDARAVASHADGPVFYVGAAFAGLPLTHAKKYPDESPIEVAFGYGDCEPPPIDDTGCTLPLEIQSAICADGHTKVGIFGKARLRERAVRHLRPVGGGDAQAPEVVLDTGPSDCAS